MQNKYLYKWEIPAKLSYPWDWIDVPKHSRCPGPCTEPCHCNREWSWALWRASCHPAEQTGAASPLYGLFSIPGLWGCSQQVSGVHPANNSQLHVAQTQTSVYCVQNPWNLQTRAVKYFIKRAKNAFLCCKSYFCISVCFMLGCLFASGVHFCPIPHQVRAATILQHPLCHL